MQTKRILRAIPSLHRWFLVTLLATQPNVAFGAPPDWARDAIWYQIFPERFRNGDPRNDPTPEGLKFTWPFAPVGQWAISPWTSDWYELQPWEKANGQGFYWNAQRRRYGGDLQGILEKLDELADLGVNALYLNPVFESPSLHKYGAAMYRHIDNNFGPDPEGDAALWAQEDPGDPATWRWTSADRLFRKLIEEAHRRDMRIIIDGVFNHCGIPFWALQHAKQAGPGSKYADWFHIEKWDDPATPEDEFAYRGWAGLKGLPEFRLDEGGPSESLKAHFHAIVRRWMDPDGDGDPSDGIDGWRLDVAAEVPLEFWREFRRWAKEINPDCYLTGEIWWQDYRTHQLKNAAPWLRAGDAFDGVMNYRFADACYQFFNQSEAPLSAQAFADTLAGIDRDYGFPSVLALQNLLDSHDTQRLASMVANPRHRLDKGANLKANPDYDVAPPSEEEKKRLRQLLVFQFIAPGAPFIYYGDEVGMWGADDPDCRKPMLWPDLEFEDERARPFGPPHPQGIKVRRDESLRKFYRKLCQLRGRHTVLRRGSFRARPSAEHPRALTVVRKGRDGEPTFTALFNASDAPVPIPNIRREDSKELLSEGINGGHIEPSGFGLWMH